MNFGEFLPTPDTLACWHLNGNFDDASSYGHNGRVMDGFELNGEKATTNVDFSKKKGRFGEGMYNTDDGSYIGFNTPIDDFQFQMNTPFTLSLWIRCFSYNSNGCNIIAVCNGEMDKGGYAISYQNGNGGSNKIEIMFQMGCKDGWTVELDYPFPYTGYPTTWNENIWHNLIVTNDGTGGTDSFRMYLDGREICKGTPEGGGDLDYKDKVLVIGSSSGSGTGLQAVDEIIIEAVCWDAVKIKKYFTYCQGRFAR